MNANRRTLAASSIVDATIHPREPQLIVLPIPIPSIPIVAPIISPIIGGSTPSTSPVTTIPTNTLPSAQSTLPTTSPSAQPTPPSDQSTPPPAQSTVAPVTLPSAQPAPSVVQPITPSSSPVPNNVGVSNPTSVSTPLLASDGSTSPVPVLAVHSTGTLPGSTKQFGSSESSPTIGGGATPLSVTSIASPASIFTSEGGAGGAGTLSSSVGTLGSGTLGSATSDPSSFSHGAVVSSGDAPTSQVSLPTVSNSAGGSNTTSAGGSSSTATGNGPDPPSNSGSEKRHISRGTIIAIAVISIALLFGLLVLFVRRRSRARRTKRANTWWFSRKHTFQPYGDRNSTEVLIGSRSARGSFASTVDHPFHATLHDSDAPNIHPPPPMAELGRGNASSLPFAIQPSGQNFEFPDQRFSRGSIQSENSQYLFVNLRNSLEDHTPVPGRSFSPLRSFAFPKPPSPIGDRTVAHSRAPDFNGTLTAMMKRPNNFDSISSPFPATPSVPATSSLIGSDPFASNPLRDNDPFEDPQPDTAPATLREIIHRPYQRASEDEVTVSVGEYVHVLTTFDDGWAYVVKLPPMGSGGGDNEDISGGGKGLIPVDCLMEAGEDSPSFTASKRVSSYEDGPTFHAL
ncbi:hypothetical protein M413DRAFT_412247 [Hebeloma cylindrosporum]|uniref:SH3 domain-containing protein n=1 Tax=Hebeloma cylindrosporum TaxID=76867 RepID=A0A0C2XU65_HEBCY|nr:hypothetical protein M413DRAFT_412247 [Hebeloma cylindrosporum h7]